MNETFISQDSNKLFDNIIMLNGPQYKNLNEKL